MCRVDITMYKDCVHHKTGSPKTTPCSHGLNPTTNGCNVGFCDLRPVILDKPSYCPECYREKERDIFAAADTILLEHHTDIQDKKNFQAHVERKHRVTLETNKDKPQILEAAIAKYEKLAPDIVSWIAESEREMLKTQDARARQLKAFRDAQGVWGDG